MSTYGISRAVGIIVVLGLGSVFGAQNTKSSQVTPNSAIVFLCPSRPDSVANYRFLSALAQLSSNQLRVIVKPAQIVSASDLLLFEAAYATGGQGQTNRLLDRALDQTGEQSRLKLSQLAQSLHVNAQRFERDLDQHTYLGLINEDTKVADGLGAGATTMFLNGLRVNGKLTTDRLDAISSSFSVPLPPGSIGAAIKFDVLSNGFARGEDNAQLIL